MRRRLKNKYSRGLNQTTNRVLVTIISLVSSQSRQMLNVKSSDQPIVVYLPSTKWQTAKVRIQLVNILGHFSS